MADYVIVGAGSAGCVLAEKLSARHTVVLLEAGGSDRTLDVAVPAAFSRLFKTPRDWNYATEPEPGAAGRSLYLPRGKMLGGSSSMNATLYIRGRPSDYDGWERLGAAGWGWASVLPIFREMEANTRGADRFHGDTGPLSVSDLRSPNPLSRRFIDAARAIGVPANHDFNGPEQEGVGFFQVTQRRGRRHSAVDAFLRPASPRPTLDVRSRCLVTRILIDKGAAVGVEYANNGRVEQVIVDGEVILAAGTFGSAHILQLSGVGEPDHLRAIGIEPVVPSPEVGHNLQDHPVVGVMYDSLQPGTLDDAENIRELARWAVSGRGRLSSSVAEACAFVRSTPGLDQPDLQFHFGPVCFDDHGQSRYPGHAFTLGPVLINPRSRGTVQARTADPRTPPAIRTRCLTDPEDVDALVRGVEIAREIVAQSPFDDYRGREVYPGHRIRTRNQIASFVRDRVELIYHPVGTCRMGSDDRAVVDSRLKVNGVDRLRVVDASVMPVITSGNTNAPTMMVAAMGAKMILSDQPSGRTS